MPKPEFKPDMPTFTGWQVLLPLVIISGITIIVSFCRDHKRKQNHISNQTRTDKRGTNCVGRIWDVYGSTLICVLSFLAAYDLYGDFNFLLTIPDQTAYIDVSIANDYHGQVECRVSSTRFTNETFFCSPKSDSPNAHDSYFSLKSRILGNDTLTEAMKIEIWEEYTGNASTVEIPGGYSCDYLWNDTNLYTSELHLNLNSCIVSACGSMTMRESEYLYGYGTCIEGSVGQKYLIVPEICDIMCSIILCKEVIKVVLIVCYFFSKAAQQPFALKFSMNCAVTGFFTMLSERYRKDVLNIKQNRTQRRTFALLVDLFGETVPQTVLAGWCLYNFPGSNQTTTYISLSGSVIMLIYSMGTFLSSLFNDYKEAKNTEELTAAAVISSTIVNVPKQQHESSFKEWFYANIRIREQEVMDQYFAIFVEQCLDSFEMFNDLTDSDLEKIGIKILGHRKLILKAIQPHKKEEMAREQENLIVKPQIVALDTNSTNTKICVWWKLNTDDIDTSNMSMNVHDICSIDIEWRYSDDKQEILKKTTHHNWNILKVDHHKILASDLDTSIFDDVLNTTGHGIYYFRITLYDRNSKISSGQMMVTTVPVKIRHIADEWNLDSKQKQLRIGRFNRKIVTRDIPGKFRHIFGTLIVSRGVNLWTLKVKKHDPNRDKCSAMIGVVNMNNRHNLQKLKSLNQCFAHSGFGYGLYLANGDVYHTKQPRVFGREVKEGDVVQIMCDYIKHTVSFIVNNISWGIAFDRSHFAANKLPHLGLAVALRGCDEIQLCDFVNEHQSLLGRKRSSSSTSTGHATAKPKGKRALTLPGSSPRSSNPYGQLQAPTHDLPIEDVEQAVEVVSDDND
eukprot:666317_1